MRKYRIGITCFLASLLVVFIAGCGQETVTIPGVVSVTPAQGANGVVISTTVTATFSMAMSPSTITSSTFTLTGPGGTAVAGAVSYSGNVATFTPAAVLAYSTTYTATITNGAATPGGAELLGNYTWSFTTLAPTALGVAVTPAPFAQNVALAATISATFSQAMNCATLASPATTFTVMDPSGAAVNGTVTCSGTVATFTPVGGALASYGTTYTATITSGAMDLAGISLAGGNYVWTFTTIPLPPTGTPAPTVISTIPVSPPLPEDVTVPLNQAVTARFSVPMDSGTIIGANFALTGPDGAVSGAVTYAASGNELLFQPSANLAPSTTYTATITGGDPGVRSLAGQPMAANYTWIFMTGTTTNTTAPELVRTVPGDTAVGVQATNVPLNQAVHATFTEAMNPLTLNTATFLLYTGTTASGTPLQATITYDDTTFIATLTPTALLTANTTYTATVTNGATDLAGNPLGTTVPSPYTNPWTFTTGTSTVTPPVVLGPFILPFGGFGGSAGMTNQGIHTVVNGNIGTTGASTTMTGFHDTSLPIVGAVWPCTYTETTLNIGQVNGTIDTGLPPPTVNCPDEGTAATMAIAIEALSEATTAYNTLQGLPSDGVLAGGLGGTTIYPGVYTNSSTVEITGGDLTLDAKGDPNATWVFQIGSSLTVGAAGQPSSVILANGAKASNIFWAVGSGATINGAGGGTFEGTVISQAGISVSTAGVSAITTINGRLIALGASTTLVNTVINTPAP